MLVILYMTCVAHLAVGQVSNSLTLSDRSGSIFPLDSSLNVFIETFGEGDDLSIYENDIDGGCIYQIKLLSSYFFFHDLPSLESVDTCALHTGAAAFLSACIIHDEMFEILGIDSIGMELFSIGLSKMEETHSLGEKVIGKNKSTGLYYFLHTSIKDGKPRLELMESY